MSYTPSTLLNVTLELQGSSFDVGKLALIDRGIYFEYSPAFIASGIEISPFKLPLKSGAKRMPDSVFDGLFGVFNDSLPDGWGRLLLDCKLQSIGIAPQLLTPIDRLAYVGPYGMGALSYEPSVAPDKGSDSIDLNRLANEAIKVFEGEADDMVGQLLELSGASAGARPKVMVGVSKDFNSLMHGQQILPLNYAHWMIKFNSRVDEMYAGRVEYAYSLMARDAGLEVMPTHLFTKGKNAFFGVQRFDRIENQRLHLHSLSGLIHQDHSIPSIDYLDVLKATHYLTKDMQEVEKAYALACFNVFAHNRDDHAKNFSFLMSKDGEWKLSPAYDLTFANGPGGEHHTSVAGEWRNPGSSHLLLLAERIGLKKKEAQEVIDRVRASVSRWASFANDAGLSKKVATNIQRVLHTIA